MVQDDFSSFICFLPMKKCVTQKKCYSTKEIAEDALIEAWISFDYSRGNGPVAVYQCDDCGEFHLTSNGPINNRLAQAIESGFIKRQKEAIQWQNKFKRH
jgi:hypothetical protein